MANKLKLREGTKYPFKHLDYPFKSFTVQGMKKKNVTAAYYMYRKKNEITCTITEFENGNITVLRTA